MPLLILLVAALYSSVGHGGASGYLAVLLLAGHESGIIRPSALLLNVVVSAIAFIQFQRAGHFRWRLFWPFAIGSIPAAFLGGGISLDPVIYQRLLALCLLFAVGRLLGVFGKWRSVLGDPAIPMAIVIGAVIGMLSGAIGIGGGIILGPVLLLFRWCHIHEAAAVSALFILVNSISGLAGLQGPILASPEIFAWLSAAVAGGIAGSYLGASRTTALHLRQLLGAVLIIACIKLLLP